MKNSMKWVAAAALVSGFVSVGAHAAPVTYQASGTITSVIDTAYDQLFTPSNPAPLVGSGYTFTFTLDDAVSSGNNLVRTYTLGPTATVAWTGGSTSFPVAGGDSLTLTNSFIADLATVQAQDPIGFGAKTASLVLIGGSGMIGGANTLAANPLDQIFAGSVISTFSLIAGGLAPFGFESFTGNVSSVAPVPLPAAAWLLLSGLVGVAAFARRRRRDEPMVGAAA